MKREFGGVEDEGDMGSPSKNYMQTLSCALHNTTKEHGSFGENIFCAVDMFCFEYDIGEDGVDLMLVSVGPEVFRDTIGDVIEELSHRPYFSDYEYGIGEVRRGEDMSPYLCKKNYLMLDRDTYCRNVPCEEKIRRLRQLFVDSSPRYAYYPCTFKKLPLKRKMANIREQACRIPMHQKQAMDNAAKVHRTKRWMRNVEQDYVRLEREMWLNRERKKECEEILKRHANVDTECKSYAASTFYYTLNNSKAIAELDKPTALLIDRENIDGDKDIQCLVINPDRQVEVMFPSGAECMELAQQDAVVGTIVIIKPHIYMTTLVDFTPMCTTVYSHMNRLKAPELKSICSETNIDFDDVKQKLQDLKGPLFKDIKSSVCNLDAKDNRTLLYPLTKTDGGSQHSIHGYRAIKDDYLQCMYIPRAYRGILPRILPDSPPPPTQNTM